jgi:hypothetical protein
MVLHFNLHREKMEKKEEIYGHLLLPSQKKRSIQVKQEVKANV